MFDMCLILCPESRDSISSCVSSSFCPWNPASLVNVPSSPQEGSVSTPSREAGMDRDTREQADSEGNGVVERYVKEGKGCFYREGSKTVKMAATVVGCWEQKGNCPQFVGICFTVNLNIFQGGRDF